MPEAKKIAEGRWRGILCALGVDDNILMGKHGPCPFCGGKDRFRYTDFKSGGEWICNQCGTGDGFDLLTRWHGWDFATAAKEVEQVAGHARQEFRPQGPDPSIRLNEIRKGVIPASLCTDVTDYLASRGLECPESLKAHRQVPYYQDKELIGHFVAMLGTVENLYGKPVTYHVTYLRNGQKAPLTPARKIMKPTEPVKGAAIRLYEPGLRLGVAEGIETAIAAKMLHGIPVWAVMSTAGMESWFPPEGVDRVFIFADNDKKFGGQKAAYALAHKLAVHGKFEEVGVIIPPRPGQDWNDVLEEVNATS